MTAGELWTDPDNPDPVLDDAYRSGIVPPEHRVTDGERDRRREHIITAVEAGRLAVNVSRNSGFAVFPCGGNKKPSRPQREGGHGCKDATTDPERIAWLWQRWPGPLIGVATGASSGVSVLDVDPDGHPEGFLWWQDNYCRLPRTLTYRTRRGGLHLYFLHRDGVTNSQGWIADGIDTRGDGGYAIFWFAAGFECVDFSPLRPWPAWLLDQLKWRKARGLPRSERLFDPDRAIDGILRRLAATPEGNRNGMLFWAARKLAEYGMSQGEIEVMLLPVCFGIGLTDQREVRATIRSAMRWGAAA